LVQSTKINHRYRILTHHQEFCEKTLPAWQPQLMFTKSCVNVLNVWKVELRSYHTNKGSVFRIWIRIH
jgi:hypothetical protein